MTIQIGIGDIVRLPFQLGAGAIYGTGAALTKGGVDYKIIRRIGITDPTPYHYVRGFANKHVGIGLHEITKSGFSKALQGVFGKGGLNTLFEVLTTKLGPRGLALLGAGGFIAAVGIYFASTLGLESWRKVTQLKQGKPADLVRSPWVHGAHALTALAMGVGCAAFLFPPTAIFGAGLAVSGFVGAMALHGVRFVMGGQHSLRYYEQWLYPFDKLAKLFTNKTNYYSR